MYCIFGIDSRVEAGRMPGCQHVSLVKYKRSDLGVEAEVVGPLECMWSYHILRSYKGWKF